MTLMKENDCVIAATYNGVPVIQLIGRLQSRDKTSEMQMAAAKCLTYLHRGGAITHDAEIIQLEVSFISAFI